MTSSQQKPVGMKLEILKVLHLVLNQLVFWFKLDVKECQFCIDYLMSFMCTKKLSVDSTNNFLTKML